MMRTATLLAALGAAVAATPAAAQCVPELSVSQSLVRFVHSGDPGAEELRERVSVSVANTGDSDCEIGLFFGQEAEGAEGLPPVTVSGLGQAITVDAAVAPAAAAGAGGESLSLAVGAGERRDFDLELRLSASWELTAGDYLQRLGLVLAGQGGAPLDSEWLDLQLTIPRAVALDFVGNVERLDLGVLSENSRTTSPPFGLRLYSTAPYRVELESDNQGRLLHDRGAATIPYAMTFDRQRVDLGGGGDQIVYPDATGATGKVAPVAVTVEPQDNPPAGDYRDRIVVTISAL